MAPGVPMGPERPEKWTSSRRWAPTVKAPSRALTRSGQTPSGKPSTVARSPGSAQIKAILSGSALPLSEKAGALQAVLDGAAPDDAETINAALGRPSSGKHLRKTSDELADDWRMAATRTSTSARRKSYEEQKFRLQASS